MNPIVKNSAFSFLKYGVAKPLAWTLLKTEIRGLENLIECESAVLACHHCIGIDGIILNTILNKGQIHFLVQYEKNFNERWPVVSKFFEQVPLKLEPNPEEGLNEAIAQCVEYYKRKNGFYGVMTDGPSKELKKDRRILELEERPNYGAAVRIALELNKIAEIEKRNSVPVLPVALKVQDNISEELWQWAEGKVWKNLAYIYRNRPVKYQVSIGKPFYTEDYRGRLVEMNRQIRLEQIRLHEGL